MGDDEAVVRAVAELRVTRFPLVIDVADLVVLGLVDADLVAVEILVGVRRQALEPLTLVRPSPPSLRGRLR